MAAPGKDRAAPVRSRFLRLVLRRGKLSPRKLATFAANRLAYLRRSERSGPAPSVLIAELTNLCNLRCRDCRGEDGAMVDYLGAGNPPIPLGSMQYDLYERVVGEAAPHLLALVLYVSGEPLVHRRVYDMVRLATERKVATVLSTNGMLLDGTAAGELLEGGLDCLKVVIGGYTQETYSVSHRGGDIATVLANLATLAEAKRRLRSPAVAVVDYIRFPHNEHEVEAARAYCERLGLLFSVRTGFTAGSDEGGKASPLAGRERIRRTPCDWLWTIMTVGWNGTVPACANCTFTSVPPVMATLAGGATVPEAWNSEGFRAFRAAHAKHGRRCHPLCRDCHYGGIRFQY